MSRHFGWLWVVDFKFVMLVTLLLLTFALPVMTTIRAERGSGGLKDIMDFNLGVEVRFLPNAAVKVELDKSGEEETLSLDTRK